MILYMMSTFFVFNQLKIMLEFQIHFNTQSSILDARYFEYIETCFDILKMKTFAQNIFSLYKSTIKTTLNISKNYKHVYFIVQWFMYI